MIERILGISSPQEQEHLWQFYDEVFRPINEETPIAQTYPKEEFLAWLADPRVIKFIAREGGKLIGLGLVATDPSLDSWLSLPYFAKHFPGVPIRDFLILAVAPGHRNKHVAVALLRAMINEVPKDGMGLFFHSKEVNPFLPRLAQIVEHGGIRQVIGTEVLVGYCWR